MFFHDLNFGLLTTLGAFSWVGLCVLNALAFSQRRDGGIFDGSILMPVSSYSSNSNYRYVDWAVIALLANLGFCMVYHLIKKGLLNVVTCLNQLGSTLSNKITHIEHQNANIEFVATQTSKDSQQLCTSFKTNQHEFLELLGTLKSIQSKSNGIPDSKMTHLTPLQQANIERSLFYLQQINDLFCVKFKKTIFSSSVDLLKTQRDLIAAKKTNATRKSVYSVRSEMILKRISHELMQPIRDQYNEMYLKNLELSIKARQLNDRRPMKIGKSRSHQDVRSAVKF